MRHGFTMVKRSFFSGWNFQGGNENVEFWKKRYGCTVVKLIPFSRNFRQNLKHFERENNAKIGDQKSHLEARIRKSEAFTVYKGLPMQY